MKLHLIGFSTDLRNLVFSNRRGAKSGNYLVEVNPRLLRTLTEMDKLAAEAASAGGEEGEWGIASDERGIRRAPARSPVVSKLAPRQIQSLLREGKTPEEVARIADADVSWIERFLRPILDERAVVVARVKAARISKPRLGPSSATVSEAVLANLHEKHVDIPPEVVDEGWSAVRRDGQWQVVFTYTFRGRRHKATFAFDHATRKVRPLNPHASAIGWRSGKEAGGEPEEKEAARAGAGRATRGGPSRPSGSAGEGSAAKEAVGSAGRSRRAEASRRTEPEATRGPSKPSSPPKKNGWSLLSRDSGARRAVAEMADRAGTSGLSRADGAALPGSAAVKAPVVRTEKVQGAHALPTAVKGARGQSKPRMGIAVPFPSAEARSGGVPRSSAGRPLRPVPRLRPGEAISLADVGWVLPGER